MNRGKKGKGFKLPGHTLPGINQRSNSNMPDGRPKSSAFQKVDENSAGNADFAAMGASTVTPQAGTGNLVQSNIENKETTENTTDGKSSIYNEDGTLKGGDKWYEKDAFTQSGVGRMYEAFKSIRQGVKNIAEKNKAKKAKNLTEAKEAVGSGTETLKQAKLVERNRIKKDKEAKKNIEKAKKDKIKLAKYRKKNPVRGQEAINLVTGGGNKSLT